MNGAIVLRRILAGVLYGMPLPRILVVLCAVLVAAAPPQPENPPRMPSQLCLAGAASGYRFDRTAKMWIPTTFGEQKYILRALNDTDRRNFAAELVAANPPPTFGLFAFGTGALNGWCSIHAPPFIKPKLLCSGWDGTLDIDPETGRFEKFTRGGFIDGSERTVLMEMGSCSPI